MSERPKRLLLDEELPLYCLEHHFSMCDIYFREKMDGIMATCDLLVRDMPPHRNFLVAGGLEAIIDFVKILTFSESQIQYLLEIGRIDNKFAKYLRNFKFTGDIWAMPEGTIHFPGEPLVRVTAPIIEATLITDQLMSLANIDTLLLSKFVRVSLAARNCICSIGNSRSQGIDAGLRATRNALFFDNFVINNLACAKRYGVKKSAIVVNANHAYIKAFPSELAALRAAAKYYPDEVMPMIDTYDIEQGINNVITVAKEIRKSGKKFAGIVIDSGDVIKIAKYARKRFDAAGESQIKFIIAGNLEEYKIDKILKQNTPVNKFLVITEVVTSADAPKLEIVYKTAQLENKGKISYTAKFSPGKFSLPGKKQVFRKFKNGLIDKDYIGLDNENLGKPLLVPIFQKGKLVYKTPIVAQTEKYLKGQLLQLPKKYLNLYKEFKSPVEVSKKVLELFKLVKTKHLS